MLGLLKFLHYVGMAVLVGGLLSAEMLNRVGQKEEGRFDSAQVLLGRLANAGFGVVFLGGIGLLVVGGWHRSLGQQPWLHVMILLALFAGAFTGIANAKARRMTELAVAERAGPRSRVSMFRWLALLASIGAVASGIWRI